MKMEDLLDFLAVCCLRQENVLQMAIEDTVFSDAKLTMSSKDAAAVVEKLLLRAKEYISDMYVEELMHARDGKCCWRMPAGSNIRNSRWLQCLGIQGQI